MHLLIGNCARAQNWEIHRVERREKQCFLFQVTDFCLFLFCFVFLGGGVGVGGVWKSLIKIFCTVKGDKTLRGITTTRDRNDDKGLDQYF